MPGLLAGGVAGQIVRPYPKLRRQKACDWQRYDLARRKQPAGIPQRAELQGKAEAIVGAATGVALPLNLRHDAFGDIFCP